MKTFSIESRSAATGFIISVVIVIGIALIGSVAQASGPSKNNYADLAQIKKNQIVIEKTREAHVDFVVAKGDNEDRVKLLAEDGWAIDWSTMTLQPSLTLLP